MYSWTEIQPAGDAAKNWNAAATDSSGRYILAAVHGGRLYGSSDYGETWTERQPKGDANYNWLSCAVSSTGQYQIAGYDGDIFLSSDYGETWEEKYPAVDSDRDWHGICMSDSGQYILVAGTYNGDANGGLYLSNDYGSTWSHIPDAEDTEPWFCCACGTTGQYMIAAQYEGRVYISNDYGNSWGETRPIDDDDYEWATCSCNASGSRLLIGHTQGDGTVYISNDYGSTWTERSVGDSDEWASSASDSTGQYLSVGSDVALFTSDDFGVTWTEVEPAGDSELSWFGLAMDSTGQVLAAGVYGGRFYIGYEEHAAVFDDEATAPAFNVDQVTAHTAQALNLLIEQYKRKDRIEALLSSLTDRIQEAENMLYAMFEAFLLDFAVGSQLDVLGTIVQEARGSSNDTEYRAFIKARIAINRSSGRIPELLNILGLIAVSGAKFQLVDYGNASMVVYQDADPNAISGPSAETFIDILKQAKAGGVNVQFVYSHYTSDNRFTLASGDTLETSNTLGFANIAQTTGGRLSGVVN